MLQSITNEHVQHTHLHVRLSDINSDQSLIIDFPECTSWKGFILEMEPVTDDDECGKYTEQK